MTNGYLGKIARINLSTGKIRIEEPDDNFYRTYMGGKGIISYYLLKELKIDIDPFSPENKLIFATGVMTGTPVSGMPRFAVGAKSPLTDGYGQSEAGGFFGPELKKAGYDALIIEGKAAKPVYIYVSNDGIGIKDAKSIWGKETGQVQEIIRQEIGHKNVRIAQIGPAGERLIRYACILNELKHANGRNGLGAVMGSKNLKAIAVRGKNKIPFANEQKIQEISKKFLNMYMDHPMSRGLYELGTPGGVTGLNAGGILPTNNFNYGEFENAEKIGGEVLAETILKSRLGCYACAIRCKRAVEINRPDFTVNPKYGGPEYETLGAFGSLCGNDDLEIIAKANEICNRFGIDTISTGASIAFAMECYENGLINNNDTDGLELTFGNKQVILPMIKKIIMREGIGDILAEGTQRASLNLGMQSQQYLMTVKNQELAIHDPRGKTGVGIGYALCETGADHMVIAHDPLFAKDGITFDSIAELGIIEPIDALDISWKKVRAYYYLQQWWSFFNMAGICDFGPAPRGSMPIKDVVEILRAATGWDTSLFEIMKAGERSTNMARMFNIKKGFSKKDDDIPERLYTPLKNGRLEGTGIDKKEFNHALSMYYEMAGWDENGIPKASKLYELNLGWLVDE
jgi:aldehyde:ferredoxin oxidoreductase